VGEQDAGVVLRIEDDGQGFTVEEKARPAPGHLGLTAMQERAETAGGWVRVESAPGAGTRLECWVPREPALRQEAA